MSIWERDALFPWANPMRKNEHATTSGRTTLTTSKIRWLVARGSDLFLHSPRNEDCIVGGGVQVQGTDQDRNVYDGFGLSGDSGPTPVFRWSTTGRSYVINIEGMRREQDVPM